MTESEKAVQTLARVLADEKDVIAIFNRFNLYLTQISQGINSADAAINCGFVKPKE